MGQTEPLSVACNTTHHKGTMANSGATVQSYGTVWIKTPMDAEVARFALSVCSTSLNCALTAL
jgi:hypothetical protein